MSKVIENLFFCSPQLLITDLTDESNRVLHHATQKSGGETRYVRIVAGLLMGCPERGPPPIIGEFRIFQTEEKVFSCKLFVFFSIS